MRDYIEFELVKALMCCVDGSCEGCPRLQTPEGEFDCKNKLKTDAADAIEELLRWRGHSFLRWEKENYKTPPTEVFHDRYYDAMQVAHAVCNANPPDGVDQETFMECLAAVFREIEELPTIKFPPREVTDDA